MSRNMKPLTLDEMEKVDGGLVVKNVTEQKYWIVRENGTVIAPAPTLELAICDYLPCKLLLTM